MSKSNWKPVYYNKKEILCMDNHKLLNAFTQAKVDETISQNFRSHIPTKLTAQIEWMRDELLCRMK